MKRISTIILLALVLCLALTACNKVTPPKETVTVGISTPEELAGIADYLGDKYSFYTFELKNDLDLTGMDWRPIGENNQNSFRATFNGNGHTISNMTIKGADGAYYDRSLPYANAGLFGYTYDADIKDLRLENLEIAFFAEQDYSHIGGLIGYAYGATKVSGVEVTGKIAMGTSFYYKKRSVLHEAVCEQTQYFGGIIGYATGGMEFSDSSADVEISNMIATLGPGFDSDTESVIFDEKVVLYDYSSPSYYPAHAFVGGVIGCMKGSSAELTDISCKAEMPMIYARSGYLGGLFGAVYSSHIANIAFEGNLGFKIYTKGVGGCIGGLVDNSVMLNAEVKDSEFLVTATKVEYEAYTIGGIAGFANDFSIIKNSGTKDTRILSNLPNKQNGGIKRSNPVIGGIAGTARDSDILDCDADGGGVYKGKENGNYIDIDANYEFSAGIVADLYGNSNVARCSSTFKACYGGIAKAADNVYVEEHGRKILRFIKKEFPRVYVGVDAAVENGRLKVDIISEDNEIIATYYYDDYSGDDIESYAANYFDADTGRLIDGSGLIMVIDGRALDDYESLTGQCVFSELKYSELSAVVLGEQDPPLEGGWRAVAALP